MSTPTSGKRPWTFYLLAGFFTLFVLFLYGPMIAIYVLSFQGPTGGLTFPLRDPSLAWFTALFGQARTGDVGGAFSRSLPLAIGVMILTILIAVPAGLAFRRRFFGSTLIFYAAIASLIVPGLVLSIGTLVTFNFLGLPARWYTSALGAHLSWTIPFGLLIMFAVLARLSPSYEEAAYDRPDPGPDAGDIDGRRRDLVHTGVRHRTGHPTHGRPPRMALRRPSRGPGVPRSRSCWLLRGCARSQRPRP